MLCLHRHCLTGTCFQFRSLPRRSRLLSLPGSPVVPDINLDCECPYNNRTNHGKSKLTGVLRSNSVTVVRPEASLNEVVEVVSGERFEQVLRDQGRFEQVLRDQGRFEQVLRDERSRLRRLPELNPPRVNSEASDFETCQMNHSSPLFLPNKSPSFGLSSFPRNGRVVESDHDDNRYKAFALMRQSTVPVNGRFQEDQLLAPNDLPDKFKESSFIVKRNASWAGSRRSDFTNLSPETSPTNGTDDVFGSFVGSTSSAATTRSTSADSAVIGSKELTYESIEGVTIDPIPEDSSSFTSVRSIGISTNFAPSFNRKTPPKIMLQNESMTRSTSTQKVSTSDFMCQAQKVSTSDFMCQAVPDRHSRGTSCLVPVAITSLSRNVGISVKPDPGYNESTQTYPVLSYDAGIQVSEKCAACGVKQTETIAIGESSVHTTDIAVGPDDDMFERIRKERQRQRELDSIFVAKPAFVTDAKSPEDTPSAVPSSPTGTGMAEMAGTGTSRIPRLQQSYGGSSDSQIVIEETCNEILVYRRPNDSMVESPGKHRAFLPQMISEESQHLISACKIEDEEAQAEEEGEEAQAKEEAEEEEEEGMSESSDDEESVVVREVLMRPPTKR